MRRVRLKMSRCHSAVMTLRCSESENEGWVSYLWNTSRYSPSLQAPLLQIFRQLCASKTLLSLTLTLDRWWCKHYCHFIICLKLTELSQCKPETPLQISSWRTPFTVITNHILVQAMSLSTHRFIYRLLSSTLQRTKQSLHWNGEWGLPWKECSILPCL